MKAAILGMGAMGAEHSAVYMSLGIRTRWYDPGHVYPSEVEPENLDELIEWADIVSICSPDNFHAEQIIAAFKMGKHVFCEKPLCHTREEFEAIRAAYNKECALGMNFPLRWHKPFVEAKLQLPDLGEIYLVEADYEYGRLHKMTDGWRSEMDYNIVMGGGLHMIDVVEWLGIYVADYGGARADHKDNLVSVFLLGLEYGLFKLTCDFGGSKNHARRLRICGTKDSLYIDDREPTDKGRALEEFLGCLRQDGIAGFLATEDVPSPEEIFRVHEIGLSL